MMTREKGLLLHLAVVSIRAASYPFLIREVAWPTVRWPYQGVLKAEEEAMWVS